MTELEAKNHALTGLVLQLIDRWWPFVHGNMPSQTAKDLHKRAADALESKVVIPLDMLLYCPSCGKQHVDEEDMEPCKEECQYAKDLSMQGSKCDGPCVYMMEGSPRWTNPPHRSHLCHFCGCVWRPADFPTNGVLLVNTVGEKDTWKAHPDVDTHRPMSGIVAEMCKTLIGRHFDQMDETHLSKPLIDKLNQLYKVL